MGCAVQQGGDEFGHDAVPARGVDVPLLDVAGILPGLEANDVGPQARQGFGGADGDDVVVAGMDQQDRAVEFTRTPVGTGPYTLAEWNPGQNITLQRRDDYWGEAPAVTKATYVFRTDPAVPSGVSSVQ